MDEQQHEKCVPSLLLCVLQSGTCVEFEEDNITVFDHIITSLLSIFSGGLATQRKYENT